MICIRFDINGNAKSSRALKTNFDHSNSKLRVRNSSGRCTRRYHRGRPSRKATRKRARVHEPSLGNLRIFDLARIQETIEPTNKPVENPPRW